MPPIETSCATFLKNNLKTKIKLMTKNELRIVFMGTPDFAVESLRRLVEGGYNVVGVVTMPDKPVGRHQDTLQPSAVKQYATEKGLRILQPEKLKDPKFVEELSSLKAHLQIVVAFRMLPEVVWQMPPMGTFNLHASLLPQYRGAAPINWAIINGNATPKDLRTMFELLHLQFTAPGDDPEAYQSLITMLKTQLENIEKVPEVAFSDSVQATFYNHDARIRRMKAPDLEKADYARMKQIAAERFNSPSDFQFFVTGNFDVDSLREYAEVYLASIPKAATAEKKQDPKFNFADGVLNNRFVREMETPKGNIVQLWHGPVAFTAKNAEVVNALGEILSQRLLKSIREDAGIAYSCGATAGASYGHKDEYTLQIYCPVQPAKADSALLLMRQGIEEIAKNGVTEEELNKVKEFELKEYADNQKDNGYWQGLIQNKVLWNVDRRAGREDAIKSVTTADVQAFCRDILLKQNNCGTVVMLPASLEEHD